MIININGRTFSSEDIFTQQRQAIEQKRCVMCKNTYQIVGRNPMEPQINMCKYKNECVDTTFGTGCDHWDPVEI